MNKTEIIVELQKHNSTVLSFPQRGPWGNSKYRGNCSGWIQAFLVWKYRVQKLAELFAGSGTGYDVASDMGISYVGADLNPVPCRPGIISLDALAEEVPERFFDADMIFMHPPYPEIGIQYAGSQYPDTEGRLAPCDIGQMSWDAGMSALNTIVMKYFSAMGKGSRMSILMGDVRRNGRCRSMLNDIVKPGELEQVLIKMQHNCVSNRRTYSNQNFVPLVHEYILVLKKPGPYILDFVLPKAYRLDIRDAKVSSWCDVVRAALTTLGGKARLPEIYAQVEGHKKTLRNHDWKAKIRQVLQKHKVFSSPERGVWELSRV